MTQQGHLQEKNHVNKKSVFGCSFVFFCGAGRGGIAPGMASEIVIRQAQVKKKFPRVTRPTETAPVVLRHPTVVARSQDVVLAGLAGVPRQAAAA